MRRISEASKRATERREREDTARRLRELVPELQSLCITIDEGQRGHSAPEVSHVRHVVVERAPALFELPCYDRTCSGGHDLTGDILRGLRAGATEIEGNDSCAGQTKHGECALEMHYVVHATYHG
jgi:hypothetical protein